MAHDVFISYAKDGEPSAREIANKFKSRGISYWAAFELRGGAHFGRGITTAIAQSRVFVLVFSADADASIYVESEAQLAFEGRKNIIPFFIQKVEPTGLLQLILVTRQRHMAVPPKDVHYEALADTVSEWLAQNPPAPAKGGRPSPNSKKAAKKTAKKSAKKKTAAAAAAGARLRRAAASKSLSSDAAAGTPEALLTYITAAPEGWPGKSRTKRGAQSSEELKVFLNFLGLRHGATSEDVVELYGQPDEENTAVKQHRTLHYISKGLTVYCAKKTDKVSLLAVEKRSNKGWEGWKKTQAGLGYLGKHRSHIVRKLGPPNSKKEVSRLNPDILDYDFAGAAGRSGYVVFDCPKSASRRCTSMQVHWFY